MNRISFLKALGVMAIAPKVLPEVMQKTCTPLQWEPQRQWPITTTMKRIRRDWVVCIDLLGRYDENTEPCYRYRQDDNLTL